MKLPLVRRLLPALTLLAPWVVVAGVAAPATALGTTYWVDGGNPSCSDAGTGTQSAPFCTVTQGAKKAVSPGDVLHVAPGTYREQLTVGGSGTSTDPITVVGDGPGVVLLGTQALGSATWTATGTNAWSTPYAPSSAPRQVFVDGDRLTQASSATGTTTGSWFYDTTAKVLYVDLGGANPGSGHQVEAGAQSFGVNVSSRHDVVVRNVETRWQNFAGVRLLSSSNVVVDQVTATGSAANGVLVDTCTGGGVVVSGATVSGSLSTGIRLSASSGVTVRGSTSHHNGLHGIGLATSSGNTIQGNTVYANVSLNPNATAAGIDVNTSSPDNVVSGNVAHDNQDTGIQSYNGSNRTLVVRNVSYANGDHGFDTLGATGVTYLNNTSYDNRRDGISVEGASTGATLANNILVDNGDATNEYDIYVDPGSVSGFSADYDVAYNHGTTPPVKFNGTVYRTLAAFTAATGQEQHGGAFAPGFADPGNGDFHLTGGSAAVDSGTSSPAGFAATDAAGNPLADDPVVPDTGAGTPAYADRGAFEFQPSGAVNYAPHSALVANPPTLAVPPSATVTLDASGSNDADLHGIASYQFDFGDGSPASGPQPAATTTHDYASTGQFTATVTVTDTTGATDTATATVTVTARQLQTYYVANQSSSCADTGAGTQAQPLCTIGAAIRKSLAGDTIEVGPGTYREQVQPLVAGQAGAPITLHGSGATTVVSGTDTDGGPAVRNYGLLLRNVGWWNVSGLAFTGQNFSGVYLDTANNVSMTGLTVTGSGSHGVTVDNSRKVDLTGITSAQNGSIGVRFSGTSDSTLSDSVTHHNQFHGVSIQGSSNITVTGVTSYGNLRPGTRVAAGIDVSAGSTGVVVQRSTTYGNDDSGLEAYTGASGTVFRRNLSYDNGDHGIDNSGAPGSVVVSNTVVGNATAGINFEGSSANATTRDNIVVDNAIGSTRTIGDIRVDESSAPGTSLNRDLVWMSNGGPLFEWRSQPHTTIASFQTASGQEPDGLGTDPQFVDLAGRDLRLTSASPAIDAAFTGLAAWLDADLAGRQPLDDPAQADSGSGPVTYADLGAREYAGPVAVGSISTTYTSSQMRIAFDATSSTGVGAPITGYQWDCGNGTTLTTATGTCSYPLGTSATVRLTVTDANGQQDRWSKTVLSTDAAPVARLTATPTSGYAPVTAQLDASASTDADATPIASYTFDCGNGQAPTTQTGPTTSCQYPTPGTYRATVTVRDTVGLAGTASVTITSLADAPPVAALTLSKGAINTGQSIVADASGSTDVDNTPVASYRFDCGNGTGSTTQAAARFTCSYPKAGKFAVRVWVTDTGGLTSSISKQLNVKAGK